MIFHGKISDSKLRKMLNAGSIVLGGNRKLKIYGRLDCQSGKRMKKKNRVFFKSEKEAHEEGFRPCGHCLPEKYRKWKAKLLKVN